MTARHAGPTRPRATPAHYLVVFLGIAATITAAAGITSGLHAAAGIGCVLIGLPCAGTGVLALLCLAADRIHQARTRRAWRRAHLDRVDPVDIEHQALDGLAARLRREP